MNNEKSVFKCGAENGLIFGLYLSAIFFTCIYGNSSFMISFLGLVMFLAVPLVIFAFMRRYHVTYPETSTFSNLWTLGTATYLFGSLICGIVTYIWLQYITPDFIVNQAKMALATDEQIPEFKNHEFTSMLRKAISDKMLPSPIMIVFQLIWATLTAGVVTSLILAPLARIGKNNKQQQ